MSGIFSGDFEIFTFPFDRETVSNLKIEEWASKLQPLVYLLSDEDLLEAYVGESFNAVSRLKQHLSNRERAKLSDLHLVVSKKFNKSATLDIEASIISHISGAGKYVLQNGNEGLVKHGYYQRSDYLLLIPEILEELRNKKIFSKSIQEIKNSNLFKFSPYKSLTGEQFSTAETLINNIVENDKTLAFVRGEAGTGKTVLGLFLAKLFVSDPETLTEMPGALLEDSWLQAIRALRKKFKIILRLQWWFPWSLFAI